MPLRDRLTRLYASWAKLRRRPLVRTACVGGVAFAEIKLSRDGQGWHPHLHILFQGTYLDQHQLAAEWHAVTGDSFIVDIRHVGDGQRAAQYVCKYASKALDSGVWQNAPKFCEALQAMREVKAFSSFGSWVGLRLSHRDPDDEEWVNVAPLGRVLELARDGDVWATGLLTLIQKGDSYGETVLDDQSGP